MSIPGKSDEDGCGLPRVVVIVTVAAMLLGGCEPQPDSPPLLTPNPPAAGPVGSHEDDPRPGTVHR